MQSVGIVINGRQHHGCGWRAQPIAGRALGVGERLAALATDEAFLLARELTFPMKAPLQRGRVPSMPPTRAVPLGGRTTGGVRH